MKEQSKFKSRDSLLKLLLKQIEEEKEDLSNEAVVPSPFRRNYDYNGNFLDRIRNRLKKLKKLKKLE